MINQARQLSRKSGPVHIRWPGGRRLVRTARLKQNIAVDGFPATIQEVEVHNVLSQGAADNLIVHVVVHLTLSANGEVRSSVDSLRADCRG